MSTFSFESFRLFLAHAPEVPDWFQGSLVKPKAPSYLSGGFIIGQDVHSYLNDDIELEQVNAAWQGQAKELKDYKNAQKSYEKDLAPTRFFEWRIYYANEMCKRLDDAQNPDKINAQPAPAPW